MTEEEAEPRRTLLRPAGVLTQLCSAGALLLATIAFVLIQQAKTGGAALAIVWAIGAMAGLVFGGLMARGGLVSLFASAAIMAVFGIVLIAIDYDTLRAILRVLPDSDVEMIGNILVGAAVVMLATAALCLASIGQARRYARAYAQAVEEAVAADPALAQSFSAMRTYPPMAALPSGPGSGSGSASGPVPAAVAPSFGPAQPGGGTLPQAARMVTPGPVLFPENSTQPGNRLAPIADDRPTDPVGRPTIPQARRTAPGFAPPPATADQAPPTDPTTPVIPDAASTNKGWTPAKTGFTTQIIIRPPQEEARSRRRIYIALGGFAIGVGAGIGVLVSSGAERAAPASASSPGNVAGGPSNPRGMSGVAPTPGRASGDAIAPGAGSGGSGVSGANVSGSAASPGGMSGGAASPGGMSGSAASPGGVSGGVASPGGAVAPAISVRTLLAAQRAAIAKGDAAAYAQTVAPNAFAIGLDGTDVAEGRDAIEQMIAKHLSDPPAGGFPVESLFVATGGTAGVAWTAEDLEIGVRRIAITELAVFDAGAWHTVALCWGTPVPDATAERMAILGTLPRAAEVPNKHDGSSELDKAVRIALSSRAAFAAARSEREDAFNFGSGPGERVQGGAAIKRLFSRLRSELKLDGGVRTAEVAPGIGWAAANVVYTQKGRAATDVSQTFRVLAVLVEEDGVWRIVQTQFSNAGPIR